MAFVNTQPEVVTYSGTGSDLQNAINAAITAGKSLYIAAGTYEVSNLGIGGRLRIFATPGAVTLKMANGALYVIYAGLYGDLTLEGLIFDSTGRTHAVDPGLPTRPLVVSKRSGSTNSTIRVRDCEFRGNGDTGLLVHATAAEITGCRFSNLDAGVYVLDADGVRIRDNDFTGIVGNGIFVTRTVPSQDGTVISGNRIRNVTQASPTSTGWEANGILATSANNMQIRDNWISGCAFSAIRVNFCTDVQITGNTALASGETAIYLEVQAGGTTLPDGFGAVVTNNLIDDTANGISLANFNGGGRLAVCSDNLIRNAVVKTLNAGQSNQATGGGFGIIAEADCAISGNVIENAATFGMILGTNTYVRDISCTDNLIRSSPIGIGFSGIKGTVADYEHQIFIASNMISHYTKDNLHGAIVPVGYNGSTYVRATVLNGQNLDIGQADVSTEYLNVRVDRNRCF